jgi:very-short-patch-repair endonuclease
VARLDLGWEELRVGCEYDGAVHDEPGQYAVDRARHNDIRLAGWLVLQVDRVMMRRPGRIVDGVVNLLRQQMAAGLGPSCGDWDVLAPLPTR